MSEKNNMDFDLMMKSVLDGAQETVPEHVWEGIASGLDKAARRRTVVLWWRHAAVGAAAAAALVFGLFFSQDSKDDFVPEARGSRMIAVSKPVYDFKEGAELLADVPELDKMALRVSEKPEHTVPVEVQETVLTAAPEEEAPLETGVQEEVPTEISTDTRPGTYFPENWPEELKRKRRISVTVSGVAGTNNAINQNGMRPMMRPQVTPLAKKTGVKDISLKSSYSIPLSAGVGVKFDISRRWSIGIGLNYTFLSRQFYGRYIQVNGDILEKNISSDIINQQHYIGIPVNIFFDVLSSDRIDFYAYAGGTAEKCVSDNYDILSADILHKEKVAGLQWSANIGIGVEFMLAKHLGLYIDPSLRYYFDTGQPKNIRTVQPLMLGFEIGLRARL